MGSAIVIDVLHGNDVWGALKRTIDLSRSDPEYSDYTGSLANASNFRTVDPPRVAGIFRKEVVFFWNEEHDDCNEALIVPMLDKSTLGKVETFVHHVESSIQTERMSQNFFNENIDDYAIMGVYSKRVNEGHEVYIEVAKILDTTCVKKDTWYAIGCYSK